MSLTNALFPRISLPELPPQDADRFVGMPATQSTLYQIEVEIELIERGAAYAGFEGLRALDWSGFPLDEYRKLRAYRLQVIELLNRGALAHR